MGKHNKEIQYLLNYIDDLSECGLEEEMVLYKPYNKSYPQGQVTLMNLWDKLGIPHKEKKQVFGSPLTIIGISVNANELSFKLSEEAKEKLVKELTLIGLEIEYPWIIHFFRLLYSKIESI